METRRKATRLVLVEPSGPINIGSVARLCENFGIKELRLVSPRCNPLEIESRRMALKGQKLLENASYYSSLIEAIQDSEDRWLELSELSE